MDETRDPKTNNKHWVLIVDYLEAYPQLLKNKFENFANDKLDLKKIWEELANNLNSMGYGKKTVEKWQLAVGRWKSKVKAKASNYKREMEKTGGGPIKSPPLSELEERLMAILGWRSILGDKNKEIGIESSRDTQTFAIDISRPASPPPLHFIKNGSKSTPEDKNNNCIKDLNTDEFPVPGTSNTQVKGNKVPCADVTKCDVNNKSFTKRKIIRSSEKTRRYVTLNNMHNENVIVLKTISKNTEDMANSIREIKDSIKEYLEYLKQKDD